MGFIRRLLGGRSSDAVPSLSTETADPADAADPAVPAAPAGPVDLDAAERGYELEVLRDEQARLGDLSLRQLKYARYSWRPPRQGGDRRADDDDADDTP
jgi:hypothetical protein